MGYAIERSKSLNWCFIVPKQSENDNADYYFPIGLGYVCSVLKETGRSVEVINMNYKRGTMIEILSPIIESKHIDVIATAGLTEQFSYLHELLAAVKRINAHIICVLGGGLVTSDPEAAMEAMGIADYGVIGEGEYTVRDLADALDGERSIETVDGLIFKCKDSYRRTSPRAEIEDLDSLPYPDYEGMEYDKIIERTFNKFTKQLPVEMKRVGYISLSRSCPFNCTFCFHPSGAKYRRRSIDSSLKEIDYQIEKFGIKSLVINDELFLAKPEDAETFCSEIKKRQLYFLINRRVDMVSRDLLRKLKDAGCVCVGFGIESADNRVLASMKKHITVEQTENALRLCVEEGLSFSGTLIFGDRAETVETYQKTLKWWHDHSEYPITLAPIQVFPGSELYKYACNAGIIKDRAEYIRQGCPYINVSRLTNDEYRNMLLQISIATKSDDNLEVVEVVYKNKGVAEATVKCPHCGQMNRIEGVQVFRFLASQLCNHCNKTYNVILSRYVSERIFLNYELFSENKIGIWPFISEVEELCKAIPDIEQNENVYFIDSSSMKQGLKHRGKEIFSPNIIAQENLETIFITVPILGATAQEIITSIRKKYTSVKQVISIDSLTAQDFSTDKYNFL